MSNFWIILWHTYSSKLKTKSFIITTLITVLLIVGITNMSKVIDVFSNGEEKVDKIAVLDKTGELYSPLSELLKMNKSKMEVESFSGAENDAEKAVKTGDYKGLLILFI